MIRFICNFHPLSIVHILDWDVSDIANCSPTDFESEYQLTEEFCQAHYLVGVLLVELRAALSEVLKVRQMAIKVLCNLLAKHAFDDRYQGSVSV